jgi:hypothetical protein
VAFDDPDQFRGDHPALGVALSAGWDLAPRPVESVGDDGTYSGFARSVLSDMGLDVAEPVIRQVLRFDIQGDGVDEALVVADDHPLGGGPGDYTAVFLREIVDGEVVTSVVEEVSYITDKTYDEYGAWNTVGAIADLNGDGDLEVVIDGGAYESWGIAVFDHVGAGEGLARVMAVGCGV